MKLKESLERLPDWLGIQKLLHTAGMLAMLRSCIRLSTGTEYILGNMLDIYKQSQHGLKCFGGQIVF